MAERVPNRKRRGRPPTSEPLSLHPQTFDEVIDDLVGAPDSEARQAQDDPQSDQEDQPAARRPKDGDGCDAT